MCAFYVFSHDAEYSMLSLCVKTQMARECCLVTLSFHQMTVLKKTKEIDPASAVSDAKHSVLARCLEPPEGHIYIHTYTYMYIYVSKPKALSLK